MNKLPPLLPHIIVSDGNAAIAFYKAAFGAVEDEAPHYAPGTTKILNARMSIHGGVFMLCDDFSKEFGMKDVTPQALGGTTVILHLHMDDGIDAAFAKAIAAGATARMPLSDQFWGDRYGQVTDPFGHTWAMGQTIAKLTAEQVDAGAEAAFKTMN